MHLQGHADAATTAVRAHVRWLGGLRVSLDTSAKRLDMYITYTRMRDADGPDAIACPSGARPRYGKGLSAHSCERPHHNAGPRGNTVYSRSAPQTVAIVVNDLKTSRRTRALTVTAERRAPIPKRQTPRKRGSLPGWPSVIGYREARPWPGSCGAYA